jgi:O-antigen ligase
VATSARALPTAAALDARVRAFDNHPRTILYGAVLGIVLIVLMAANLDASVPVVGWLVATVAVLAPSVGLATLATLAVIREPAGLGPLFFYGTVVGACALGVTARVLLGSWSGRSTTLRPEFLAIATYLGICVFQFMAVSADVSQEREQFARIQLTNVAGSLVLVMLVATTFTAQSRRYLVAAMVPGILLGAVTAVASLNPALIAGLPLGGLLPPEDISVRATGIFLNPNYLGLAMAIAALLLLRGGRLGLPTRFAGWSWLLALPPVLAVGASFSRGAFLALVGGVVALYANRGRRSLVIAGLVGVLVIGLGYPLLIGTRHSLIFGGNTAQSEVAQQISDSSRVAVHIAGLRLFKHSPVLGIGYGQFHYESAKYMGKNAITYPHDGYLQVLAEQGIVGFVAFGLFLVLLLLALSRIRDAYAITARSMLVAFAIGSLFAEPMTSPQSSAVLWIMIGAALIGAGRAEVDAPPGDVLREPAARPIWFRPQPADADAPPRSALT